MKRGIITTGKLPELKTRLLQYYIGESVSTFQNINYLFLTKQTIMKTP